MPVWRTPLSHRETAAAPPSTTCDATVRFTDDGEVRSCDAHPPNTHTDTEASDLAKLRATSTEEWQAPAEVSDLAREAPELNRRPTSGREVTDLSKGRRLILVERSLTLVTREASDLSREACVSPIERRLTSK